MEQRDDELLSRSGFFKQFQWLSGIVVWTGEEDEKGEGKCLWANPQALSLSLRPRHPGRLRFLCILRAVGGHTVSCVADMKGKPPR